MQLFTDTGVLWAALDPAGWVSIVIVAFLILYFGFLRPLFLTWGSTPAEVEKYLPGDELVAEPKLASTRTITIYAHPFKVWPWLVQMGQDRGGFYSYQWLENLMGLEIQNAREIIPEYQNLKVGDTIKFSPKGGMKVLALEQGRALVLGGVRDPKRDPEGKSPEIDASWVFYLDLAEENITRLNVRFRMTWKPSFLVWMAYRLILEPSHFIMERKMLLGLKKRAESTKDVYVSS